LRNTATHSALHCGVVPLPNSLLTTKLYPPTARPNLVQRHRLTERLVAGLQRPLTLISAPAGFGKTSLLSDWRATPAGQAYPLAWLSLDQGENAPARFWAYVLAALRTLPELAGVPDELDADAPPDQLLVPLINGLETAACPVLLVLDDYHMIDAPAIHAAVGFLVEHMPAGLRLVVLTRADPPWPMARLRAHGLLSELRAADLRFTAAEVTEFFTRAAGLPLSDTDIAAVEQRTEGWIAALQMVAISLDGHPDPSGFVSAFSGENRYITDYLTEEVLARQPEPLRRFLLQVSILERFSAPLCAAVTGCPDSRALIDQIERRALFLVPLDPMRQWFRFHHLFGDLLRTYLRQTEPDLVPVLHGRAATWHAENGLPMEAARHSLAARDYDHTLAIIEQHAGGWWAMASPGFSDLLFQLPPEVARRSPLVCTYQAWIACMMGQTASALELVGAAERDAPLPASSQSFLALIRAFIGELTGQPCELTETVMRAPASIPEDGGLDFRSTADLALAFLLYMNGRFDPAAALLMQVAEREVARHTTYAIPVAIPLLTQIRLIEGRVDEAAVLCRRYISIIHERGEGSFFVWGNLRAGLADALRLQGDLEEAEVQAREGLRANRAYDIHHAVIMPLHALARVRLARGEAGEALALLEEEEAATRGRSLSPDQISDRETLRVQAWLATGNLDSPQRWARECGLGANDPLSFRQELGHMALAQVLLATGRQAEGTALLLRLARAAETAGRLGRLADIRRLISHVTAPGSVHLSEREREILHLVAAGRSNQEIARSLVVAVGTVKIHVHNLFQKLEVRSRTQAVARARELDLLR
jgi:LuxR family transcriptional regulator, maltose regulon positive regulatory protein